MLVLFAAFNFPHQKVGSNLNMQSDAHHFILVRAAFAGQFKDGTGSFTIYLRLNGI